MQCIRYRAVIDKPFYNHQRRFLPELRDASVFAGLLTNMFVLIRGAFTGTGAAAVVSGALYLYGFVVLIRGALNRN